MSSDTVFNAIKVYLDANWTTTALRYENSTLSLPDTPISFVFVEISGDIYKQESIGAGTVSSNLWRETGLLWLHVMVPSGTGSATARQYLRQLSEMLRDVELLSGRLTFMDMSIGLGSPGDEDGNYWRLSMSVEWKLDT